MASTRKLLFLAVLNLSMLSEFCVAEQDENSDEGAYRVIVSFILVVLCLVGENRSPP